MLCVVAVKVSFCLVLVSTNVADVPPHLITLVDHLHVAAHARPFHILST